MSAEQSEPATNPFKSGRRVVPVEVSVRRYEPATGAMQQITGWGESPRWGRHR
jgi:hypothetical protein